MGDVIGLIEVMNPSTSEADVAGANIRFHTDNEEPVMAGALRAEVD